MADLDNLTYGKIVGRFVAVVADTDDAGLNPDAVPLSGVVTFTPLVSGPLRVTGATPPVIAVPTPVQVNLDAEGDIQAPSGGGEGVMLLATNAATDPTNWTYRVGFSLTDAQNQPYPIPSFEISVPGGSTQDLALLIPSSPGGGGSPVTYIAPPQVVVSTTQPVFSTQGIWFKKVGPDTVELWVEDGGA